MERHRVARRRSAGFAGDAEAQVRQRHRGEDGGVDRDFGRRVVSAFERRTVHQPDENAPVAGVGDGEGVLAVDSAHARRPDERCADHGRHVEQRRPVQTRREDPGRRVVNRKQDSFVERCRLPQRDADRVRKVRPVRRRFAANAEDGIGIRFDRAFVPERRIPGARIARNGRRHAIDRVQAGNRRIDVARSGIDVDPGNPEREVRHGNALSGRGGIRRVKNHKSGNDAVALVAGNRDDQRRVAGERHVRRVRQAVVERRAVADHVVRRIDRGRTGRPDVAHLVVEARRDRIGREFGFASFQIGRDGVRDEAGVRDVNEVRHKRRVHGVDVPRNAVRDHLNRVRVDVVEGDVDRRENAVCAARLRKVVNLNGRGAAAADHGELVLVRMLRQTDRRAERRSGLRGVPSGKAARKNLRGVSAALPDANALDRRIQFVDAETRREGANRRTPGGALRVSDFPLLHGGDDGKILFRRHAHDRRNHCNGEKNRQPAPRRALDGQCKEMGHLSKSPGRTAGGGEIAMTPRRADMVPKKMTMDKMVLFNRKKMILE